jgi:hypothetical protein
MPISPSEMTMTMMTLTTASTMTSVSQPVKSLFVVDSDGDVLPSDFTATTDWGTMDRTYYRVSIQ